MEVFFKEVSKRTKPVKKANYLYRHPRRDVCPPAFPLRTEFARDPGEFEVTLTGRILARRSLQSALPRSLGEGPDKSPSGSMSSKPKASSVDVSSCGFTARPSPASASNLPTAALSARITSAMFGVV